MDKIRINIPSKLKNKLSEDKIYETFTYQVIKNVQQIFLESPFFFPEYTDHGINHEERVLEICDKLISHKSLDVINSRDMFILIISAITHDIGMFITADGLEQLLFGKYKDRITNILDDYTWENAWKCYLKSVKHYPEKKLVQIFGDAEPIVSPPRDMGKLTYKDRLIYGDFLRMFHHRLSHEIINYGFIGRDLVSIFDNVDIDDELKDIIGLINRSHGENLRSFENYLYEKYPYPSKPKNVPIYYLMSILRMADYLDADISRASNIIYEMHSKKSKISEKEFLWNQSIQFEDYVWDNEAEKLVIYANPQNGDEFINVEKWLSNLQYELDLSWAVIGEKYGIEKNMLLNIRRIDSNILNPINRKAFEKKYVTRKANLTVNPELLKLLVKPLYENNSIFGIRELIQNAVDACNEREYLDKKEGNKYEGKIIVEVDTYLNHLLIQDNGIGMTCDTIIDYYLSAGSSYRYSDAWINNMCTNDKSNISRIGKFGIGVLASFLLGNKVKVKTRSIFDTLGYEFEVSLNSENININRVKCEIGTDISIVLKDCSFLEEKYENIKWNAWYYANHPKIIYKVNGEEINSELKIVPRECDDIKNWNNYKFSSYNNVKWSYDNAPAVTVNGFIVPVKSYYNTINILSGGYNFVCPNVALIDNEGLLPMNLIRTKILEHPRDKRFINEICKYAIAQLLLLPNYLEDFFVKESYDLGGFSIKTVSTLLVDMQIVFSKAGYTVWLNEFLDAAGVELIAMIELKNESFKNLREIVNNFDIPFCVKNFNWETGEMELIRTKSYKFILLSQEYEHMVPFIKKNCNANKFKLISLEDRFLFYNQLKYKKIMETVNLKHIKGIVVTNPYFNYYTSNFCNILKEVLGEDIWIPYEFNDRKSKFKHAFNVLSDYMNLGD